MLSAYLGYKDLTTAEHFLSVVPESYRRDLSRLCLKHDVGTTLGTLIAEEER